MSSDETVNVPQVGSLFLKDKFIRMEKVFRIDNNSNTTNIGLLIARVGIAALMLTHGIPKMVMLLSGAPLQFPEVMGMSAGFSLGLAVFAEVLCSVLILTGFATRLATIPLIITMLVAAFYIHATDPLAVKEPALYYLLVYMVLLFAGSGKYSLDSLIQSKYSLAGVRRESEDPALSVYKQAI